MPDTMRAAILDAVVSAKLDGTILIVHQTAERIVSMQGASGQGITDMVCRALVQEGARRGVAMEFSRRAPSLQAIDLETLQ